MIISRRKFVAYQFSEEKPANLKIGIKSRITEKRNKKLEKSNRNYLKQKEVVKEAKSLNHISTASDDHPLAVDGFQKITFGKTTGDNDLEHGFMISDQDDQDDMQVLLNGRSKNFF
ncbi:hypothetical protein LOAG_05086 [Loa loa]|uniref:Uncharacterized protein n=1 Tax=Loa loa TaxID=7209 RepID=A0A1S0U2F7_LOALO|nr:hypothetical protein LOAG_05086 [Loa loa]EFO23402.1 hypothetical protein LOAG_05086 [Loa loa]